MAVLMVDLDDTLVDRSQAMQEWAARTSKRHPDNEGLEEWLVEWDCDRDAVRDRHDFLSGVRSRLGLTQSVDELLHRWPYEFGGQYRLDDATRNALHNTRRRGIPVVIVTNGVTAHQEAKLDAIGARDVVDGCLGTCRRTQTGPAHLRTCRRIGGAGVGRVLDAG